MRHLHRRTHAGAAVTNPFATCTAGCALAQPSPTHAPRAVSCMSAVEGIKRGPPPSASRLARTPLAPAEARSPRASPARHQRRTLCSRRVNPKP
eukprot:308466-Chlamydomonas_euryale.AAC.13